jgi:hypothetical protein
VGEREAEFKIELVGVTVKANPRTLSRGSVASQNVAGRFSHFPVAVANLLESPEFDVGHFSVQ